MRKLIDAAFCVHAGLNAAQTNGSGQMVSGSDFDYGGMRCDTLGAFATLLCAFSSCSFACFLFPSRHC